MFRLSDSAWALSYVLIGLWVGQIVITPLAGRFAAAKHPLQVMIYADCVRLAAQGGLFVALLFLDNSIPAMTISAILYGVGSGVYRPTQQTALPSLISPSLLVKANASFSAAMDIGFILGPAMGLVAIEFVGFAGVLMIDCLSFVVNIAALLWLLAVVKDEARRQGGSAKDAPRDTPAERARHLAAIRLGTVRTAWRVATRDRFLGASLGFWTVASVLIGMISVYAPTRIIDQFRDPQAWAIISTVMALSSLVGSVFGGAEKKRLYPVGITATAFFLIVQLALVHHGFQQLGALASMLYLVFGAGALATTWSGIQWTTAVQHRLSRAELGRFSAVKMALTGFGVPVGMAIGPVLTVGPWVIVLPIVAAITATAAALAVRQSIKECHE